MIDEQWLVDQEARSYGAEMVDVGTLRKALTKIRRLSARTPKLVMLDPEMPASDLRLHMGEMTAPEMRTARAAIR